MDQIWALDPLQSVLGEGMKLAALGIVLGIAVSLPSTRLLRSLLFDVTATDPLTFVLASAGLVLIALPACYLPARRALKIDPAHALRTD